MANEIYNTTWWGTALDTARTAGTDPDFFGSQMKLLTSEQDNLVTNGDFEDGLYGWTSEGGVWTAQNGYVNGNGANGASEELTKSSVTTIGKFYKVVFEVSNYVSGSVIFLGGNIGYVTSNGTYTDYYTPGSSTIRFRGINFNGSIDNVSVQLVRCDLDQIEAKKCLADWIHRTALQDLNN